MLQKPHSQQIGSVSLGQRGIGLLSPKIDVQLVAILCNQGCVWVGQGDMIIVLSFAGQSKVQTKVRRAKRLSAA